MNFHERVKNLGGKNSDEWDDADVFLFQKWKEIEQLKKDAELKAMSEFYLQKERLKIKLNQNTMIDPTEIQELDQLKEQLKEQQKAKDPKYAIFITVNPKVNDLSGYQDLDKKVRKCLSKYWITDYAYCYEQRSDNADSIHGLHAHILITRGAHKPSHCEREIINTFISLCGNAKHVNIQYKRKEWIKDKLEYMKGNKTGDGKDIKVSVDKIMREQLKVEPLIVKGFSEFLS